MFQDHTVTQRVRQNYRGVTRVQVGQNDASATASIRYVHKDTQVTEKKTHQSTHNPSCLM